MMVADFEAAFPLVRHVTVGAGHARTRVNTLIPELELGVLSLEHGSSCVGMNPVAEFLLLVVGQNVIYLETLGPGIDQPSS
jgi:hypothetical protein